ncbi:glycosyltransferase family 2 protein [Alcaligenes faecalis]|uniref:glycosyltransferase family 2 protein n=1 Tax=Alcaligenes aquatilis TaxID=323284 RepID=UPI002AA8D591|nr:glycosyltransferase family 2 protein [Alcaligenes faecalis]
MPNMIKNTTELVSVIMPAYNAQDTLELSANSVLEQTHSSLELIIVNDCSKDDTLKVMTQLANKDSRVKLINLTKNSGVAEARNAGIKIATGKYIAFLDSDDLWFQRKTEKQLLLMKETKSCVCMAAYYRFKIPGDWIGTSMPPKSTNYNKLLKGNVIGNLTGIYNCEILGKFYQEKIHHEDFLMWLKISEKSGPIPAVLEPIAAYRVGHSSLSSNKIKSAIWTWDIYRKQLNLGLAKSIYFFVTYLIKASLKRI